MNNLSRVLIVIAAAASGAVVASSAQAATYPLGTISSGIGNLTEAVGVGSFADNFTFEVSQPSSVGAQVDNLNLSLTFDKITTSVLNISGLDVQLDSPSGQLTSASSGTSLSYANLKVNTPYQFVVTGVGTGVAGGEYAIAYNVSAVPIPGALPLFGAALTGIAGFAGFRKRAAKAV